MWHGHDGEQLLLVLFCFAYGLDANSVSIHRRTVEMWYMRTE